MRLELLKSYHAKGCEVLPAQDIAAGAYGVHPGRYEELLDGPADIYPLDEDVWELAGLLIDAAAVGKIRCFGPLEPRLEARLSVEDAIGWLEGAPDKAFGATDPAVGPARKIMRRTAFTRLALAVERQLSAERGGNVHAFEVMTRLQVMAESGDHPPLVCRHEDGVKWQSDRMPKPQYVSLADLSRLLRKH